MDLRLGISSIWHSYEPPQFVDLSGALIETWALRTSHGVRLQVSQSPTTGFGPVVSSCFHGDSGCLHITHHFQMPLTKHFGCGKNNTRKAKFLDLEGIRQVEAKRLCADGDNPCILVGNLWNQSCQSSHRLEWWKRLEKTAAESDLKKKNNSNIHKI